MRKKTEVNIVFINDKTQTYGIGSHFTEFDDTERISHGCYLSHKMLDSFRGLDLFISENSNDTGAMVEVLENEGYKLGLK